MDKITRPGRDFFAVAALASGLQQLVIADFLFPSCRRRSPILSWVSCGPIGARHSRCSAALLSGLMVFLWVLLLHLPRTVGMKTTFELDGVFEALAISGVVLLVAGRSPLGDRPDGNSSAT